MRLLHKNGRILLQSVPSLISRAPDHLAQLIGFTRDDLILFFKRHNAVFQLYTDGTVSVKSDAVRALLNKNDTNNNNNNNNILQTSLSLTQLSQQSSNTITAMGIVIRIFPKYGILNMDNNEQVFFDIQSCHFETFNDLTCVVNPGDSMNFNAILGPKDGRFQFFFSNIIIPKIRFHSHRKNVLLFILSYRHHYFSGSNKADDMILVSEKVFIKI
jgi:hypothetical protein